MTNQIIIHDSNYIQPNIKKPIPRSKTISNWKQIDSISISKIIIRCQCDQCESIESPEFNFTLFDLNLMNNQNIVRTVFPSFPVPHFAAYGPITKTELWNISIKKCYEIGWQCFKVCDEFYQYRDSDNRSYMFHDAVYKWIAPEHKEFFGGDQ